jgi:plastocyanin
MSIWGRHVRAAHVASAAIVLLLVGSLASAFSSSAAREVTLVAKDMTFYLEGGTSPNPVIEARAGERLRVVLRNRDRGMTHDLSVPVAKASTDLLRWNEADSVTFTVPDAPGTYEYVCRPHLLMMKGTLKVSR